MKKYLHYYETEAAFNEAYNGETYIEPWVSCTKKNVQKKVKADTFYYIDMNTEGNPATFIGSDCDITPLGKVTAYMAPCQ